MTELTALPEDALLHVLSYLTVIDIICLRRVCALSRHARLLIDDFGQGEHFLLRSYPAADSMDQCISAIRPSSRALRCVFNGS